MKFSTLFKKNSSGTIQFWEIEVCPCVGTGQDLPSEIITNYGQVGTDKVQTTFDVISEGKNTGKKNATTCHEQAIKEAQAKWEKKKKSGYVESVFDAKDGKLDDLIEGGVEPMFAHKFAEKADKIVYPAAVQPKLDGIRCIAILKDGKCTLWSRTRKQINSMPHIVKAVEVVFQGQDITLDGELYNHSMKSDFEKIVSLVRKDEPGKGHEIVQYHIYDVITSMPFRQRQAMLLPLAENFQGRVLVDVRTVQAIDESEIMEWFYLFKSEGYEGAMVRNIASPYVNKRSKDLLKVKEMDDEEFKITGIEGGRGKLAGHAIFKCETPDGKEFLAKMKGETSQLKKFFDDHSLWMGKSLTVQYQGLTGYGLPRFPVGLRIREEE